MYIVLISCICSYVGLTISKPGNNVCKCSKLLIFLNYVVLPSLHAHPLQ